jgi:hypothetical protein
MQKVCKTEAAVAQVVERRTLKVNVASSTPCKGRSLLQRKNCGNFLIVFFFNVCLLPIFLSSLNPTYATFLSLLQWANTLDMRRACSMEAPLLLKRPTRFYFPQVWSVVYRRLALARFLFVVLTASCLFVSPISLWLTITIWNSNLLWMWTSI